MSWRTWKAEFYNVNVAKAAAESPVAAVEHSLKKWEGLLPENLKRHNLIIRGESNLVYRGRWVLGIHCESCACCARWLYRNPGCAGCPLYEDGRSCDGGVDRPYNVFLDTGDPKPMIALLKRALKRAKKMKEAP